MHPGKAQATLQAARELAHAATFVASEAAALARATGLEGGGIEGVAASHAALEAAQRAFDLDEASATAGDPLPDDALRGALQLAARALDAAREALDAAERTVAAARVSLGEAA